MRLTTIKRSSAANFALLLHRAISRTTTATVVRMPSVMPICQTLAPSGLFCIVEPSMEVPVVVVAMAVMYRLERPEIVQVTALQAGITKRKWRTIKLKAFETRRKRSCNDAKGSPVDLLPLHSTCRVLAKPDTVPPAPHA